MEASLSIEEIQEAVPKYKEYFDDEVFVRYLKKKVRDRQGKMRVSSFKLYVHILDDFFTYMKMSPSEMVGSWKNARDSDSPREFNQLVDAWEEKITDWFDSMLRQDGEPEEEGKHDWNGCVKWWIIANEFLVDNKIRLNLEFDYRTKQAESTYAPTVEEVRKAYDIAKSEGDVDLAQYILVAKDCGISEGDLINYDITQRWNDPKHNIEYPSVKEQYKKGLAPIFLIGTREKTGIQFCGFLGEEALANIIFYGKHLTAFGSIRPIQRRFEHLSAKMGQPLFLARKLRQFVYTRITAGSGKFMNATMAEILAGRRVQTVGAKYYVDIDPIEMSKAYASVYDNLRIFNHDSIKSDV